MITRRQFLVHGLRGTGDWLLSARLAREIGHLAEEHGRPYLVEVEHPEVTLFANKDIDGYRFTLGVPQSEECLPETLNWRQWFEVKGVSLKKPKQVLECAIEHELHDPDAGTIYVPPNLDEKIPDALMEHYIESEFIMYSCPSARAFHYLSDLNLGPLRPKAGSEPLGQLEFMETPSMCNNSHLVTAPDLETVSCLQQGLLALNIRAKIEVVNY